MRVCIVAEGCYPFVVGGVSNKDFLLSFKLFMVVL